MAITYNDQYKDIYNAYFHDESEGTYTALGGDGHNIDYFPDDAIANDAILFVVSRSEQGKYNEIKFNVTTQLVADAITVIWEYARRTGGTYSIPAWYSLAGVTDNTDAFRNAGVNSVVFTCPEDWENFINPGGTYAYSWVVRCRIVSTTNLTEGGKQTADAITIKPNTIWISEFSSETPCTLQDIYDADVDGSWGVVTKTDQLYTFDCNLYTDSSTGYFYTSQEVIQFKKNWDVWFAGKIVSGKVFSGSKVYHGSTFIFNLYNGDLGGKLAEVNAEIYNTQYRYKHMDGSSVYHGHWGGSLGNRPGQTIYDVYAEGLRQFRFSNDANAIIGVKGRGFHIETPGAILKDITCFGGGYSIRLSGSKGDYIHTSDFSGAVISPINPYRATQVEDADFDAVDCNWGTFEDSHKAYWKTTITDDYYQGWVWETYSMLLQIIDKNNNAISGATVILIDKDGTEIFSYTTNVDGTPGQESGTVSSATASTLTDDSKSWSSNEWWFQEVYITSGTGIGQRRIIKKGNTATELQVAPDWDTIPDVTSKYIIIPYVRAKQMLSPATEPESSGSYWSLVTDYSPFTITISKAGYQTYKKKFTLDKKIDWIIALTPARIQIDQECLA